VVPIEYTGIVVVTVLGYVFFREVPGVSVWVGVPLVIAAGLLIVWGESKSGLARECARTQRATCGPRTPVR